MLKTVPQKKNDFDSALSSAFDKKIFTDTELLSKKSG